MIYNDLISIIVPVYDVEPYLKRCVDSIIGQSYKNIEIILVDDGSNDGSSKICDDYLQVDNRIVVIHQGNRGLSNARNVGINKSRGKYISFVDSDDFIDENYIELLYAAILGQEVDIAICDIRSFDNKTLQWFPHNRYLSNGFVDINCIFETMMWSEYPWIYTMCCNKLYSRHLFNGIGFRDGFIHEDEIIFLDVVKQNPKVYQINNTLYYYCRGRENSIINKKYSIKRLDVLVAFYDRIKYFKQNGFKNRKLIKNEQVKIFRKLKVVLTKMDFETYKDIFLYQKELRKAVKNCLRSFKCLKMYLSIIFSKKYFSICRKKQLLRF